MARVLDSVTLPIKKNGTKTNQNYINNPKSIAPQFSASTAYTAGQYVFYDNSGKTRVLAMFGVFSSSE